MLGVQAADSALDLEHTGLLAPVAAVVVAAVAVVIAVPLLGLVLVGSRGALRGWRRRRMRMRAAALAEHRARALMGELCPNGWRAQITLFDAGGDGPGAGERRRAPVALDWTELRGDSGRPAIVRRVWAESIGDALEAMVADRRTDETLERIERGAVAEGAHWPDL
jgi:hypothetical protein